MCKTKAEGGARCEPHTRKILTNAVASYAAAVNPTMKQQQAKQVLSDLEREGSHLPDPSRDEVDGWISQTITAVRNDPSVPETRRERILTALRSAFGKVLPSGAQFHAWKNALAESLRRSRRAAAAAFMAGVISFAGACGGVGDTDGGSPAPSAETSATVSPSVPAGAAEYAGALPEPSIADNANARYGEKTTKAVYAQAEDYITEHRYDDYFHISRAEATPDQFKGVAALMTPERAKEFNRDVRKAATDDGAYATVQAIAPYGYVGTIQDTEGVRHDLAVRTDVPNIAIQKQISAPRVTLGNDGRLYAKGAFAATMRLSVDKEPSLLPVAQDLSIAYKKVDGKWLIDGWKVDQTKGADREMRPDTF